MEEIVINKTDEMVMKLLHYFITEENYSPIVLHGAKNEIWLENLNQEYKIVRIVTDYIHNDEQFNFDLYKTKQIMKKIKNKTLSMNISTLSIFINLGDNVHLEQYQNQIENDILMVEIKEISDLKKYNLVIDHFPSIINKTKFQEKGSELFMKLTQDITKKNEQENLQAEDVFKIKKPIITYILIAINAIVMLMYILSSSDVVMFGANIGDLIKAGEYYRLITSAFIHAGLLHFICNMYALYVVGPQLESFFGKWKYLTIYLGSAVTGNLLSMAFTTGASVGASGAIFGLFGSLLYFGYHYRIYLGGVLKSQIIPLIAINLCLGLFISGIDTAAHIGGLIGGLLITMALGVKYKSTSDEKINGSIMTIIYVGFLIYLNFFR